MLCRYAIEFSKDKRGLLRNFIPREDLANWKQAEQLLRQANEQADELLNLTKKKCESLREQASLEIWRRADAQLKRWEHDRQTMCDRLEHYANSITREAIRCLLDETVAPTRLAALLKQLLANQVHEISAILLCHPHDIEEIKQCLAYHKASVWKLHADETLTPQTLVLKTDEGDFRISWSAMLADFFKHAN
ncbi:type III secretion system stator protein SctL [Pseudomonas sp. SWRI18]|uniref:type III secretion system stator protein SctL n=1 Tax=Pseudomonas TaxID=286 RepID=UPI001648D750|nr:MULTISPECIES: type III secretion system stator protein SctL [Pseudomonas]MBC3300468.1 type III secretion system stator protein SctL [Pseudomonas sp. SWRI18]MDQ0650851.1 type III secretion protein L [Pseudomonas cedrina]